MTASASEPDDDDAGTPPAVPYDLAVDRKSVV